MPSPVEGSRHSPAGPGTRTGDDRTGDDRPVRLRLSGVSDPFPDVSAPTEVSTAEHPAVPLAVSPAASAWLPTGGWTVPAGPPAARAHRPVQGRKVMLGGGLAVAGHGLAVVATFVVGYTGSVYGFAWLFIVAIEALLFLACLVCGIVWIVARDRGIGIGLLVGWPVGLLVPVVVIGFYVLGMMAPIDAVLGAEVA